MQPNLKWCSWNFKTVWDIIPYNLCLLAAVIESDYDVEVIDANIDNWTEELFAQKIAESKPDFVGITVMTTEYAEVGHVAARIIKEVDPAILTVMGGIYVSTASELAGKDENLDYMILGEGELVIGELLKYLNGLGPMPEVGVAYKENEEFILPKKYGYVEDLDSLPFPAYHLVDYPRYIASTTKRVDAPRRTPYARIRTSRGCPIGCCFCQVETIVGKKVRKRSVDHVIRELKWQKETYGIKSVLFNDDNLILDKNRAKKLFKAMIDHQLDLTWNGTAIAVFSLDDELLELMKASGCQYVDIAVESGVPRILKEIIGKPVDLDYTKKMVKKIHELEIDCVANFVIGFPTETWEEIRTTLKFAEDLAVDYVKIFIATPLPNTRLYDMVLEHNMAVDKDNLNRDLNWSMGKIVSREFNPKDLSILRAYEWDRINFTDPLRRKKAARMMGVSEEELNQIRRKTLNSVTI